MLHLERILLESSWRWRRKERDCKGVWQNHAVRNTSIGGLLDADVPANYVAQLSGHKNLKSLDSYKSASLLHQRKMSLVLTRSEHVKSTANTATTNKLAISTASDSKTNSNALVSDPPDTPGAASATLDLFSGATIGKIEGCSFTFNLVARDMNKDRKPRKRHVSVSDDSDSEWRICKTLFFRLLYRQLFIGGADNTTLSCIRSFSHVFTVKPTMRCTIHGWRHTIFDWQVVFWQV